MTRKREKTHRVGLWDRVAEEKYRSMSVSLRGLTEKRREGKKEKRRDGEKKLLF